MDEVNWILIIVFTLLVFVVLFFPKIGLWERWRQYKKSQKKELLEDALKYIFDQEQQGHYVNTDSLQGKLKLNPKTVFNLLAQMESQGLVNHHQNRINLSENGEKLALQIVRAHRLWERYLADEARLHLDKVHTVAQRR